MAESWESKLLRTLEEVQSVLLDLSGKPWLCRGQNEPFGNLFPRIDRGVLKTLRRAEKLALERQSVNLFRSSARALAPGEQKALDDDVVALMLLGHFGVPTRLLDWSASPWVAAYFAAQGPDDKDGEIWAFDRPQYETKGKEQWKRWPETTTDGTGADDKFDANLTAFRLEEPRPWLIAAFYEPGFPRHIAQQSRYTMTARFGIDHAKAIADLLRAESEHRLFRIGASVKPALRTVLREEHGVWRGSLFPDTAGAAETARAVFPTPNPPACGRPPG
jgi:hypothetical protein